MVEPPELARRELRDVETVQAMYDALKLLDESPTADNAAELMWKSSHKLVRNVMPAALLAIGGEKARRELRKALGKEDRAQSCLLDLLTNEGPTEELAGFLKDEESDVRAQAARLLVIRGDSAAADALRKAIDSEDDKSALAAEVAALVRLQGAGAADIARQHLGRCTVPGKIEIAAALAAAGEKKGFQVLESAARSADRYIRYHACQALAATGNAEAEKALLRALKDRSRWVRQAATAGLARCGGKKSIEPLKRAVSEDTEACLRSEAHWALGEVNQRLAQEGKRK